MTRFAVRRQTRLQISFLFLLFLPSIQPITAGPQMGAETLFRNAYDLKNGGLRVLSIAMEPGHEDLRALAYLRAERSAEIVSAYVTNGEAGEADDFSEYPLMLAGRRREEAYRALKHVDGEVRFLNLPDFGLSWDTAHIQSYWPVDSLRKVLEELLSDVAPDIVLLAHDHDGPKNKSTARWKLVRDGLLSAARSVQGLNIRSAWKVDRILFDDGSGKGERFPGFSKNTGDRDFWTRQLNRARSSYRSLADQRRMWLTDSLAAYQSWSGKPGEPAARLDSGLPLRPPGTYRWIVRQNEALATNILNSLKKIRTPGSKATREYLKSITQITDSVNLHARHVLGRSRTGVRWIGNWRKRLDNLKNTLLGVEVAYEFSDTTLCELQLTMLRIDSISGETGDGLTELYFPEVDKDWIFNETKSNRTQVSTEEMRLLSPSVINYNVPPQDYGLDDETYGTAFTFHVIHQAKDRTKSFVKGITQPMMMSPKFSLEVLSPFVRVADGERLIIRLTNRSRDGVADVVHVQDAFASSAEYPFRLSGKDLSHTDTLFIQWSPELPEGTHVFGISIGSVPFARFAARKFEADVDSTRRIGLVPSTQPTVLAESLRRLGLQFSVLEADALGGDVRSRYDVIFVDRRALTVAPGVVSGWSSLIRFAGEGGNLIVCAQDPEVWNTVPMTPAFSLRGTDVLGVTFPVEGDSTHPLLGMPNRIAEEDWDGWVFQRGYADVDLPQGLSYITPVTDGPSGIPLVLIRQIGAGSLIYLNLALHPQLLNIHPGAFRLFANLISYKGE